MRRDAPLARRVCEVRGGILLRRLHPHLVCFGRFGHLVTPNRTGPVRFARRTSLVTVSGAADLSGDGKQCGGPSRRGGVTEQLGIGLGLADLADLDWILDHQSEPDTRVDLGHFKIIVVKAPPRWEGAQTWARCMPALSGPKKAPYCLRNGVVIILLWSVNLPSWMMTRMLPKFLRASKRCIVSTFSVLETTFA
ncbi:hypothetical protein Taro_052672 [Colocasia esculenta]|uniref:Uncharacterized protein n=1 Tax=Colocasia esculenta TaxID=4460 RepID=A0A843XKF2_COLES|nr:hypothetical protein [Colocasia esculenta]